MGDPRISGMEFLSLARHAIGPIATRYAMQEAEAVDHDSYAEVRFAGPARALVVGMEWAQDYDVYVTIARTDRNSEPVVSPTKPEDFSSFDLRTVLARSGIDAEGLGHFGPGDRQEIEAILDRLRVDITEHAASLLGDDQSEWHRLQRIAADRVARQAGLT